MDMRIEASVVFERIRGSFGALSWGAAESNSRRIIQAVVFVLVIGALPSRGARPVLLELGASLYKCVITKSGQHLFAVCIRSIVQECAGALESDGRGSGTERFKNVRITKCLFLRI